jgi:NAD(P)-dependent dehydrogenase (short-subunit alcohol dehydrogenase family)
VGTGLVNAPGPKLLPVDLTGERVIVTAGAAGIGRAVAAAFLARGAKVALCDIDAAAVSEAEANLPGALCRVVDVAERQAVVDFCAEAEAAFGGIDILINNAGIAGPTANVEDVDPDALEATLAVNVESQFWAAAGVVPGMKGRRKGAIINLSSIAGRLAFAMRSPYAASKWAVVGFSRSLAAELGPHDIRVNALLPGHVRTKRFERVVEAKAKVQGISVDDMRRDYLSVVSLERNVEKEDIANMALYLASDFGRNITGQAISVCGDVHMMR